MRAVICNAFGAYDFEKVEGLCADEFAQVAGSALWIKDQEAKTLGKVKGRKR